MGGLGVVLGWSGGAGGRPGALPCSVALVFFKNNASHAAWRSFWAAGVPPRGAQEAPRRPQEAPKGPQDPPKTNHQTNKQSNNETNNQTNKQSNKQSNNETNNQTNKQTIKQ